MIMRTLFSHLNRKVILVAGLLLLSLNCSAQISGYFGWSRSEHRYFYLTNTSGYILNISWNIKNYQTGETRSGIYNIRPNETMNLGPETINWIWIKGEEITIIVDNSYSYQWVNDITDPEITDPEYPAIPFKGAHNKKLYDSDGNKLGSGIYYSTSNSFSYKGYTYDVVSSNNRHYTYQLAKNGSRLDAYFN